MKKHILTVFLAVSLLVGYGCNPCKRLARRCPPVVEIQHDTVIQVKDSLRIEYRDRIIRDTIPGDTVKVETLIPSTDLINLPPIKADVRYARASAWVERSILRLQLEQKEQVIVHVLDSADRQVTYWRERFESVNKQETKIVTEKYIPKFYKFTMWVFVGLIVAGGVYLYARLR